MKKLSLLLFLIACGPKTNTVEQPVAEAPDAGPTAVEPTPDTDPQALLDAELAAYQAAAPVFDAACSRCHKQGARNANEDKLGHFDMTTYPFGGHHTDTITATIRHVLGIDGAKPSMPKDDPGAVGGDGLALIAAWADAYDAADAAGAHEAAP